MYPVSLEWVLITLYGCYFSLAWDERIEVLSVSVMQAGVTCMSFSNYTA